MAAVHFLSACEPASGPERSTNLPSSGAEDSRAPGSSVVPKGAHLVALRVLVSDADGTKPTESVGRLHLLDLRRSVSYNVAFQSDAIGVYALRAGRYSIEQIGELRCTFGYFTVGERDGLVSLGTLEVNMFDRPNSGASLRAQTASEQELDVLVDRVGPLKGRLHSASVALPQDSLCDASKAPPSSGEIAGSVALGVVGLALLIPIPLMAFSGGEFKM